MDPLRTRTALLVEDDPLFRSLLRDHLNELGFAVTEAADGRTALHILKSLVPDLVCLDLMLPALSGLSVCKALRDAPATRKLPVLMMSARSSPQDRAHAEEVGADLYLVKPFAREALSAAIRTLLEPKRRRPRK